MLNPETCVIGSLLIEPVAVLPLLRGRLNVASFGSEANQKLFAAACDIADENGVLDAETITKRAGTSEKYSMDLMEITPTAAHVEAYVDDLLDKNLGHSIRELCETTGNRLLAGTEPAKAVYADLQSRLAAIGEAQARPNLISSRKAMMDFAHYRMEKDEGSSGFVVPTEYGQLDYILGGGFVEEGLYILAARPGCGKTTFALNIAENAAKAGRPVLFVSLEMSQTQITAKRVAIEMGISGAKLLMGLLDNEDWTKINAAGSILSKRPIYFNSRPWATVDDIALMARQVEGLRLVVIDYLGLIRHTEGKTLYEKTTATSAALKRMARSLGVPVLCLAQLNREVEGRSSGKPRLSDLRDSGSIEQDADAVLLLHKTSELADSVVKMAHLTCNVAKNRHAGTGETDMNFYLESGRIRRNVCTVWRNNI